MIASACLLLLRVSLGTAPHSVAVTDKPPALFGPGLDEIVGVCLPLFLAG